MAIQPTARRRRTLLEWWHGLPWNGLFWALLLLLAAPTVGFAVRAELDLARLVGVEKGHGADIAEGDLVRVVLILNGDEVVVEKGERRSRLRMLGIRSFDPVVNEREITAYGDASVQFLKTWILNKDVRLEFDKPIKDTQDRYLAYVRLDDIDVNRRMIEDGITMVYTEFKTAREADYLMAEISPRRASVGVWGAQRSVRRIEALRSDWFAIRQGRGDPPVDPLIASSMQSGDEPPGAPP